MELLEQRHEVTVKELAATYGVTEAAVDSALRECVANLHSPHLIAGPGRYRLTRQDLARIKNALSR